ncbi:MAG: aldo/keto reductase [Planctomycetota bacterium]
MYLTIDGVRVPRFLYGTAWKEEATEGLTLLALRQGFRGIDTANQQHYHEAGVGTGIAAALKAKIVIREELFLQTKFTFLAGQDQRLPYDPKAPVATQVRQSVARSLEHLGVDRLDSLVLHGPSIRAGLAAADREAWLAMETAHDEGLARLLGVSNVTLEQLDRFCQQARIPPRFVQNRCYASQGWDRAVRAYCAKNGLVYQGFSLLTANRELFRHAAIQRIAKRHAKDMVQILFRFALDVGMIPLTGTTKANHMSADLEVFDFSLSKDEVEIVDRVLG